MHLPVTTLLVLLVTLASSRDCLTDTEAYDIADRWTHWLESDASGKSISSGEHVINTFTVTVTDWDEGNSSEEWGIVKCYIKGLPQRRDYYLQLATSSQPWGGLLTDVKHEMLYTWHNCDNIFVRYQKTAKVGPSDHVHVPLGTHVSNKGSVHLAINLDTRKIYNVTMSSDFVNLVLQLKMYEESRNWKDNSS